MKPWWYFIKGVFDVVEIRAVFCGLYLIDVTAVRQT